jgi:RHS repeat-associated protein
MTVPTATASGPRSRAVRRPPGRLDSHNPWTKRRGPVTAVPSAGAPGSSQTFTYSSRDDLTSTDDSGTTFTYDDGDNTTQVTGGTTQAFDYAHELTASTPMSGPATDYTYDNRGDRVSSTVSGAVSSTAYAYDQADNLVSYTPAGGSASTYTYDGNGLRATKTPAGSGTENMTWDVSGSLPLLLNDGTNDYIYGPGGLLIEQVNGSTPTYDLSDQLGSTVMLTNTSGSVDGAYTYDAYGSSTHSGTATTPLQYAGQYLDSESGLYYMRARYYDPSTAQFLTVEPLAAITHDPYGYAQENPAETADPSGLSSHDYSYDLGQLGSPEAVAAYVVSDCSQIFPIEGCIDNFQTGQTVHLQGKFGFYTQSFPVRVGVCQILCVRPMAAVS